MSSSDPDLARRLIACSEGVKVEVSEGGAVLMGIVDGDVCVLLRGTGGEDLLLLNMDSSSTRQVAGALLTLAERSETSPSGRLS